MGIKGERKGWCEIPLKAYYNLAGNMSPSPVQILLKIRNVTGGITAFSFKINHHDKIPKLAVKYCDKGTKFDSWSLIKRRLKNEEQKLLG